MSTNAQQSTPPKVFISYSHDDKDHKAWVTSLASRLRAKGVDVILDHWDTEPGDDLAKFMERGVRDSDRVLMICTEKYVRKVDDGKGGAGYEAMIVSSELIADQGIRKFVPIVRQTTKKRAIPTALDTRKYIDLSEDAADVEEAFSELLESIHRVIAHKKPALGPNPYGDLKALHPPVVENLTEASAPASSLDYYNRSLALIESNDRVGWRKLLQSNVQVGANHLLSWKANNQRKCPELNESEPLPWLTYFGEGISGYDPLLACLLAAAESGNPDFSGQLGWIDLVLEPKGWERSGSTVWTQLPRAVLFSLQAYFGAMLMRCAGGDQALKLATTPVQDSSTRSISEPLFLSHDVSGWIETFGGNCALSWAYLNAVGDKKPWLAEAFEGEDNVKAGKVAYYMLLSFLEFVKDASKATWTFDPKRSSLEVSHMFAQSDGEIHSAAFRILIENTPTLLRILEANGIEKDRLSELWPQWISGVRTWATSLRNGFRFYGDAFPFGNLPIELYRNPFDLRFS